MAAIATKIKCFNTQHIMPVWMCAYKATQNDYINTTETTPTYRGFMPLNAVSYSATASTGLPLIAHGLGLIDNLAATYTAATTSLAVNGIAPYSGITRTPPYYIMLQDAGTTAFEICEVTGDTLPTAAATVLTVKRACFGTTASLAGVADNSYVYFLNILVLADATIGTVLIYGIPLPAEPGAKLFA